MKRRKNLSPLGPWLSRSGLTEAQFAALMTKARGARTYQSQVSVWATGKQEPTDVTIVAIERVTGKAVKREEWACWRRRNRPVARAS